MQERIAGAGKARIKELDNGVDQFVPKPFVFFLAPPSRKPADYDPAAFQGIHARYVLVIIDEAGGVPKSILDAVDALATKF